MEYGEVVGGPGETDLDHGLSRREIRDHSHALNSRFTTGPLEVDEKIRSRGYAWPNPTSPERMYLVRLGGIHAPHFTSPEFGRLHQFSVVESHPDGTVLEFCSKERGRSYLQGLIQFNSAGEARWIRWEHYLEGERYSGGHATFPEAPSNDDARQYLLPDWSRSWRNLGREDWQGEPQYRFIEETFLSWSIDGRRVF